MEQPSGEKAKHSQRRADSKTTSAHLAPALKDGDGSLAENWTEWQECHDNRHCLSWAWFDALPALYRMTGRAELLQARSTSRWVTENLNGIPESGF